MMSIPWDDALESELKAEFSNATDDAVREAAMLGAGAVRRGRATYELTRRALTDPALLPAALAALDADHVKKPKQFPPLGWAAAARILSSEEPAAVEGLVATMSAWDAGDQRDFLEWCLPRGSRMAHLRALEANYGYQPTFELVG